MKRLLGFLAITLTLTTIARADFYPIPLTAGSFNQDVVVEKTASPPAQALVTANMDAGTNIAGTTGGTGGNQSSFYEIGFGTTAGTGLPYHGAIFYAVSNAPGTTAHRFQMAPNYTANNAVFVGGYGTTAVQVPSGSLTLVPATYDHLSVLAAAGNGPLPLLYTVYYNDGNQDANYFVLPDYLQTNNATLGSYATGPSNTAWIANARFQGTDGSFQNVNTTPGQARLFYYDITLSFPASQVTNISFSVYDPDGRHFRAAIFGLSGSTDGGVTYSPIAVSGYNYDMIAEAPLANAVTATVDNGVLVVTNLNRGDNNTWYERGFNLIQAGLAGTGLPIHGTTFTALSNANYSFTMPSTYVGNCALMVGRDGFTNGTLTLTAPAIYTNLALLHAGNGYMGSNYYVIHHADSTTEAGVMTNFDWFQASDATGPSNPTNKVAWVSAGRVTMGRANTINNGGAATAAKAFWTDIRVTNTISAVTSLDIIYGGTLGNRTHIFALSGCDGSSALNTPIPINPANYNVDVVVEASAITNMDARAYTTVTMDGATNNNANTWYERGWNPLASLSGLPPAGSTIDSTNLPDHHYQFASSYAGPNCVYADSNTPSSTITFTTPAIYYGLSFLSANANGAVQVRVVINHQTAGPETNVFNSKDWFNGTPAAFTANGRLNSDTKSLNNWIPTTTSNPRLYEAQFAITNTTDPVVGATLIWTTNNGTGGATAANTRFYVMAVSGTTNLLAPIISVNPVGTNVYEGSNIVLRAQISGGTTPFTYEWRKGTNGVYGPALADGGTVSGATSTNLTFTSIGWTNSADYIFIGRGLGGSSTSLVATVNAYSTLPPVTAPSDPIVEYQPNGGSSPGAETVPRAIDRLVGTDPGKYVNSGQNNGAPFAGPVGLVVSPRLGRTTVSAVRLYTADNNQQNDPADWTLEGSNDGGTTWTTIHSINFAATALSLPAGRNNAASAALNPLTQNVREIHFANSAGYTTFRVSFAHTTNDAVATAIGIGEVELLGTNTPSAPLITRQPRNLTVWPGGNPEFSVFAFGFPTNLAYQWFRGGLPVSGATRSAYTLTNAQVSDSGATFSCTITNTGGSTNSALATLTVSGAAPTTAYPVAIIADHPVGFWRLGEADTGYPNNGVVAHDYFGGLDGSYSNATLGAVGYNPAADADTAATFGTAVSPQHNSYVDNIQGVDFAAPSNSAMAFSIEAWVLNGNFGGQLTDAGIVTKGYGGGGEQFALDCGSSGASHKFRFFVRGATGATYGGNANATVGPTNAVGPFDGNPLGVDGTWHHVIGTFDLTTSNLILYVDGISNAAAASFASNGVLASPWPVTIGSRQPSLILDYTNQFIGSVDEVSIYNYALSPAQVLNHYYAAHPLPIITLQPTNTDFSDNGPLTLYSAAYGPSLSYQWYQSPDQVNWSAVGGQTSATFNNPNTPASFGPYVEVAISNPYGSRTSSIVTLTPHSGPPVILTDLVPTNAVYAGGSISLSVTANGTQPLNYQWYASPDNVTFTALSNGGRISGAQSNVLTIASSLGSDSAFYKVIVSNVPGSAESVHEYLIVQGQALLNGNGVGWRLNGDAVNGGAANSIANNVFTPTDGTTGENRAVWYSTRLYVGAFQASFTYQDVGGNGADGSTFVLQNDPRAFTALGGAGGGLGYSGITPSVALEINIYSGAGGGPYPNGGVLLNMNGTAISTNNPFYQPAPLNIDAGNPVNVSVRYVGGVLSASLVDTVTLNAFNTNLVVNIPSIVGASTAIVGLTGSEGGVLSHQTISNFVYTPLPMLSSGLTTTNTVVLTWSGLIGGYQLQSTTSLAPVNWLPVANPVIQVGGQNQVVVPVSGNAYYRLSLQ